MLFSPDGATGLQSKVEVCENSKCGREHSANYRRSFHRWLGRWIFLSLASKRVTKVLEQAHRGTHSVEGLAGQRCAADKPVVLPASDAGETTHTHSSALFSRHRTNWHHRWFGLTLLEAGKRNAGELGCDGPFYSQSRVKSCRWLWRAWCVASATTDMALCKRRCSTCTCIGFYLL